MIRRIAYRAARAGITGIRLAVARITGETAPPCSPPPITSSEHLNAPMASLPAVTPVRARPAPSRKLAWTGALIITFTVLALSIIARALTASRKTS
jgi:phosphate transport system permease protein